MVTIQTNKDNTHIILSPNRSIEWKAIKYWLLIISLPALIIAIDWLIMGLWMILPFVGIELGLLSYFMYRICYKNYYQQYIDINKNSVTVTAGIHPPLQQQLFTRPDCYLS
ncbi:MAG: DUF2244 domain-containing protein, partial [Exilibacterium sp.]